MGREVQSRSVNAVEVQTDDGVFLQVRARLVVCELGLTRTGLLV